MKKENEIQTEKRFIDRPGVKKRLLLAGAAGAIGLTVLVILARRKHIEHSKQLKAIARDAQNANDPTANLIDSAEGLAHQLRSNDAAEVASELAKELSDHPIAEPLEAISALARKTKSKIK